MSKSQVCACCTHEVYGSGKLLALFICSKCGRFRLAWQGNALPCFALLDQRWEESDLGEKPQRRGAFFIVVVLREMRAGCRLGRSQLLAWQGIQTKISEVYMIVLHREEVDM